MPISPAERLRERIRREGPISFADFMEEALYGEDGYYTREKLPIGEDGDFVTGSSHSPLFGRTTAELLRRLDRELGKPADYLEVGYGGGGPGRRPRWRLRPVRTDRSPASKSGPALRG